MLQGAGAQVVHDQVLAIAGEQGGEQHALATAKRTYTRGNFHWNAV